MTSTLSGSIRENTKPTRAGIARLVFGFAALLIVAGCASPDKYRAPVEDRSLATRHVAGAPASAASAPAVPAAEPAVKPLPGSENAGKAGFYTVRPGDTLIRIGLETGQSWKDILKWNNLENPNVIEVGQVLRVVAPGADPNAVVTRPVTLPRLESRPIDPSKPPPTTPPASPSPPAASTPPAVPPALPAPPVAREGDDNVNWLWPAAGAVVSNFDEARTKGIAIAGKPGDTVVAAADGKVVYAGSGLRGYGNLVIIKHNNTYLTAYAHNQALMVKEEQAVKRGQKIAEMGSSDAERVQLHFEIRKQGKPVDPAKLLPQR
ncbi:peptidoglycan DD-metalloendopeptidase family protein [Piscinibacter sp. HJYY11]|uniref:peptidoglycan DD-metalloendopeptidase family protein n=1 Tax=Piscinibacter sp. HJYY11 TaxID=2801333 RepID=UPI00191E0A55|nr:peptidoglycan DD-metalloendopeptidase family protein [Piscinibacter sp. HJYY11]MBL0731089.1 peptidoglycan DD-metalloendopeptidase family protein [Piscinibacter sp. HJYY11]